ncbi:MAG: phosphatase PAP2 family protein, partial [Nocardioidaceae bacterium]
VVFGTVYFSHFITGLTIAMVLWLVNRGEWAKWMRRYLGLNILGLVIYITYPMAPPWMAAQQGHIEAHMPRLTSRGSDDLGLGGFHVDLADVGNPVAAMPSLHAGIAGLVAFYGIQRLQSRARWLLLLYPLTMSLLLVYNAEHYVIDAIAGFAAAGLVLWACEWWERSRRRLDRWQGSSPQEILGAQATPLVGRTRMQESSLVRDRTSARVELVED